MAMKWTKFVRWLGGLLMSVGGKMMAKGRAMSHYGKTTGATK